MKGKRSRKEQPKEKMLARTFRLLWAHNAKSCKTLQDEISKNQEKSVGSEFLRW
jgi:hypothetical protein